jgi:hypothetical protein
MRSGETCLGCAFIEVVVIDEQEQNLDTEDEALRDKSKAMGALLFLCLMLEQILSKSNIY